MSSFVIATGSASASFLNANSTVAINSANELTLTGTGTAWTGATTFTVSGHSGTVKTFQDVSSGTSAQVFLDVGPAAGTITISDGSTTANVEVRVGTFVVVSSAVLPPNTTTTVELRGSNTLWDSYVDPLTAFTIEGVTGASFGAGFYNDDNTTGFLDITTGTAGGTLTITDATTDYAQAVTVVAATSSVVTLIPQATVYFTLGRNPDYMTLDDPVRGELDSIYTLQSDIAYDVTPSVRSIYVRRGRSSRLNDDISPGRAVITFSNHDRQFDPTNASSPWYGNIVPGKRVVLAANYVTYFDGYVDDWNFYESIASNEATAEVLVFDALGSLSRREFDEWNTSDLQLPGARIASVLDRNEVAYGAQRWLDTGVFQLQTDLVTHGSNVLNYLQLVAKSDFGYFFATREGLLRFKDRSSFANVTPVQVSMASDSVTPFHELNMQYGSETLFNRVSIDREGGTAQTVTDDVSIEAYGTRSYTLSGLLMSSDNQALGLAQYLLNLYAEPALRISSVTVKLHALTSDYLLQLFTSLDIGDPLSVLTTFNGVDSVIAGIIEGIEHDVGPKTHVMRFLLSDLDASTSFLTLDDADLGQLNVSVLSF